MNQRGTDVGRVEALLQQALDEMIVFPVFAAGEQGTQFFEENIFARLGDFVHRGNFSALDADIREPLDVADLEQLAVRNQRDRASAASGASGAADAMNIIFRD